MLQVKKSLSVALFIFQVEIDNQQLFAETGSHDATDNVLMHCALRSGDDSSNFFFIRVQEFYKNGTLASSSSQAARALHIHNSFYKFVDLDVQIISRILSPA